MAGVPARPRDARRARAGKDPENPAYSGSDAPHLAPVGKSIPVPHQAHSGLDSSPRSDEALDGPAPSHVMQLVGTHWPWQAIGSSPLAVAHNLMHGPGCPHSRCIDAGCNSAVAARIHVTRDADDSDAEDHVHVDFLLADGSVDCPLEPWRAPKLCKPCLPKRLPSETPSTASSTEDLFSFES
mmetsp:Transcript_8990/g.26951  ORF Transcript_8990/g.26951 Transcript_8990/m.26951 type:complete len:183 (-) Transcript_8990:8-556(-)